MESKNKDKSEKKKLLKNLIDATIKFEPNNKPMRILKARINMGDNVDMIMDTVHTNDDERNEKILKFFMELDALITQFIDCIGLEIKNDN